VNEGPRRLAQLDGRHDFDGLLGHWAVWNRKLTRPLDPACTEWIEFAATVDVLPVLEGLGNIDRYSTHDFPGRPNYAGLGLRLFDVEADVWRIWWASAGDGVLDTPVVGRFTDGRGVFECNDELDGRQVTVRYLWSDITASAATWRQSFSFDEGASWCENWEMAWRRDEQREMDR
jgi:hypothetical protein